MGMIDRRTLIAAALIVASEPSCSRTVRAQGGMSHITAFAFSFRAVEGGDIRLSAKHARKKVAERKTPLIVAFLVSDLRTCLSAALLRPKSAQKSPQ
jgi:hypothetical protein